MPAPSGARDGTPVQAFVRPHNIRVRRPNGDNPIDLGRIERLTRVGGYVKVYVSLPSGDSVTVLMSKVDLDALAVEPGDPVAVDVVDAKREDWERDPFTLFEENGFFYGRGTSDMKGQAAVWLDLMIRLKQERNFRPSRDLVMALTCGEETSNRVNGIDYVDLRFDNRIFVRPSARANAVVVDAGVVRPAAVRKRR